jgi:hypothetical protein
VTQLKPRDLLTRERAEPIVSTNTPHLFGWKIPDMLFGEPLL